METGFTNLTEQAILLALIAHNNQKDKRGLPYILHSLAVANDPSLTSEEEIQTAALHDTLEDTDMDVGLIERCFGKKVRDAVEAISKRKGEKLEEYWARVMANPMALKVKFADIKHNMSRLCFLPDGERIRLTKKYEKALSFFG